ncbi:MAG: S8 family serine peptidase [Planctomycetes bacterium]|nr:S8 family serine peptidase [Planctomycetota bacterium]
MRTRTLVLALGLSLLTGGIQAQEPAVLPVTHVPAAAPADLVADGYIVMFRDTAVDLEVYRQAILAERPAHEVAAIIADFEATLRRERAGFVAAVENLGGRVTSQWWIVNGCYVRISQDKVAQLRALPGVDSVQQDRWYTLDLADATNATHHNSDAANLKQANGKAVRGSGISVAVLDSGADANMGGTGRPHRAYFPGGNPANTTGGGIGGSLLRVAHGTSGYGSEDLNGHGTFVAGCVGANKWSTSSIVDDGIAPDAWIVSVKVSNDQGAANGQWLIDGWNWVANNRVTYNIRVANNSFSGSPSMSDPIQIALDNCAYFSDIVIAVSAGNLGANTQSSQAAYNGLAVGSVDKYSLTRSSFSAVGPLYLESRTYPDIVACGSGILSTLRDSESQLSQASGTSFSSPMVAGAAALVRQTQPAMSAVEVRALLLNTTNSVGADRNQFGLGFMRADKVVDAALLYDVQKVRLTNPTKVRNFTFQGVQGQPKSITVSWMRAGSVTPYNLDLRIYNPNNTLVASDLNLWNAYEKVTFTPSVTGTYRAEVTWTNLVGGSAFVDFAIAGVGRLATAPPTLTSLTPSTVNSRGGETVTIDGTNLDSATKVTIGATDVTSLNIQSATRISFTMPGPFAIGSHNLTVTNTAGVSNALPLQVNGSHPGVLTGPGVAVRGTFPSVYKLYTDNAWTAVFLLSTSNVPSVLPGIANLGIGNNFAELLILGNYVADNRGYAEVTLTYPTSMPALTVYCQALFVNTAAPVLPLENSAVVTTSVF